jgi:hypothetical protein
MVQVQIYRVVHGAIPMPKYSFISPAESRIISPENNPTHIPFDNSGIAHASTLNLGYSPLSNVAKYLKSVHDRITRPNCTNTSIAGSTPHP